MTPNSLSYLVPVAALLGRRSHACQMSCVGSCRLAVLGKLLTLPTACARNTVHALPPTFAAFGGSTDEELGMPPSYMWSYHFPVTARQEDVTSITIDPISRTLLTSWHSPTFNLTKLGEGPFSRAYSGFGSQGSYCFSILPSILKYCTDKYHADMATRRRMIVVVPCGKRMCPLFCVSDSRPFIPFSSI